MERIQSDRAFLDCGAGVCVICADDFEIEVSMPGPVDLKNKRVLVVGLARTGVATALFCAARGAKVTATESRNDTDIADAVAQLRALGVTLELGGHQEQTFVQQDLIVPSPGVPADFPLLPVARAKGVKV